MELQKHSTPPSGDAIRYRPEIDGLRAVAVVPVILFHAGFDLFSGGYVGVDVFFVISGYLITSIIHADIQRGRFSILSFYDRRARRILPALLTVCLICIPFAWMWMLPFEFKDFAQSLVAVNFFASNILFWIETDYFAPASELKPLLHTWSLAVEEQFYLFYPLLLILVARFRPNSPRTLLVVLVTLSIVSMALAEWAARMHPTANFFLLPTRAWELGVGAVLAITGVDRRTCDGSVSQCLSLIGVGAIIYAVFAFDDSIPFPGLAALVPARIRRMKT